MISTYSDFSSVCSKFYDELIDAEQVGEFVLSKVEEHCPQTGLFVGGFFLVAKYLVEQGINLAVCDYTEEMLKEARTRLPATRVLLADLKNLPFEGEFDSIFVIGRVFTHMLNDADVFSAIQGFHRGLKAGGIVLFDNYEESKIRETSYFNGRVSVGEGETEIVRDSSTELISESPYIVNWKARYTWQQDDAQKAHEDEMLHRAFSRNEIRFFLEASGFEVLSQGENFDETSFFTLARR